jgi:hypothetical protein
MSTSSFATDTFEPYVSPEVAAKYLGISRRELLAYTRRRSLRWSCRRPRRSAEGLALQDQRARRRHEPSDCCNAEQL